jgi:hypothetical protein
VSSTPGVAAGVLARGPGGFRREAAMAPTATGMPMATAMAMASARLRGTTEV